MPRPGEKNTETGIGEHQQMTCQTPLWCNLNNVTDSYFTLRVGRLERGEAALRTYNLLPHRKVYIGVPSVWICKPGLS